MDSVVEEGPSLNQRGFVTGNKHYLVVSPLINDVEE